MKHKYVYLDTETFGVERRWDMTPREFFRLGQWAYDDGPIETTDDYDVFMAAASDAQYIVGHNVYYDLTFAMFGKDSLMPLHLAQNRRVLDTMTLAHLLTPAPYSYTSRGGHTFYDAAKPDKAKLYYSLDNLAYQFNLPGKVGSLQDLAKKYNPPKTLISNLDYGLIPVDDPEFLEYAIGDIEAVRALFKHLMYVQASTEYSGEYMWRELELAAITARITANGIRVDTEAVLEEIGRQIDRKASIMNWLVSEYGFPTEGKQPWKTLAGKDAILRALASYGLTPDSSHEWTLTANGAPSFSGETLLAVTAGTDAAPLGAALAELQGQRSLAQLALDSIQADGKVHFEITAFQRSGRWSMPITIWDNDNKFMFIGEDGYHPVEFDYSNADARAVAALSGDEEYAKRFATDAAGNDLYDGHNLTGQAAFGKNIYDAAVDEHGKYLLRPLAKVVGHGTSYNMGSKKLAATLNEAARKLGLDREYTKADADNIIHSLDSTFVKVKRWKDRSAEEGDSGMVVNAWNRRMPVDRDRSWTQSPALLGQSTTREVMGDALIKICRLGGNWPYRLRGIIHDALVIDLPAKTIEQDAATVQECMRSTLHPKGGIPIPFPAGVGPLDGKNWKEASH